MFRLIALLFCLVICTSALADDDQHEITLAECLQRADLTFKLLHTVKDGTPMAEIQFNWPSPAPTPEDDVARTEFIEQFKAEVTAAMATVDSKNPDFIALVSQRILEKCAFEMGKQRGDLKEVGKANAKKMAYQEPIQLAQSEQFANPQGYKESYCGYEAASAKLLWRIVVTMNEEEFWLAHGQDEGVTPERLEWLKAYVHRAYEAKNARSFVQGEYDRCMAEPTK